MIFILKNLYSKTIMIISNKAFNIIRKVELLINAINDFVLFNYIKTFYIREIVNKKKYIKT